MRGSRTLEKKQRKNNNNDNSNSGNKISLTIGNI